MLHFSRRARATRGSRRPLLLRTKLYDWHLARGAKTAPFAGYDMPISYPTGAVEEHLLCRRSVGLFDIDHMGQVEVSGPGADEFVSRIASARVLDMRDGDARYSLLLDERASSWTISSFTGCRAVVDSRQRLQPRLRPRVDPRSGA